MDPRAEEELLARISGGGAAAWDLFLDAWSATIYRVVCVLADGHDDRMDLFMHACARLREDDMRRVRAFRRRPEAPCRFSTWLAVVVKNVALDDMRSRDGRFRPFRVIDAMEEPDRLIFEYYHHQGRSLEEVRSLLAARHGIRLTEAEADARTARVSALLTPSQRWRLLARLGERRGPLPLDPLDREAPGAGQVVAEAGEEADPERPLLQQAAARALDDAFRSMEPPQRLALTLRFRDGLAVREVAGFMHVTPEEASRLEGAGLERVREAVRRHGVSRPDIETKSLSLPWTGA